MTDIKMHEKIQRMANRIINGLEVKYEPLVHIPLLFAKLSSGGDIAAFTSEAEIARSTFYRWIDGHPEFGRAYEAAREMARIWWESQPVENGGLIELDGIKFNTKLWTTIMKNRFELTDQRKLTLPNFKKCKTLNEKINCLLDYVGDGELTSHETSQLSGLVLAAVKVDEYTNIAPRLAALEAAQEK